MSLPSVHPVHRTRVLLVEPHADTRAMYRALLELRRWRVSESETGRAALDLAASIAPDVVVVEARLPEYSGFDLCRDLRANPITSHVAIVLVTSDTLRTTQAAAAACGADRVMLKPCLPERFHLELEEAVASRCARDAARDGPPAAGAQTAGALAVAEPVDTESTRGESAGAEPARRGAAGLEEREDDRDEDGEAEKGRRDGRRRPRLAKASMRHVTSSPAVAAPPLKCPACDGWLRYERSHVGGVTASRLEQWDYYRCQRGCGEFQYRHRNRRLRRL